MSDLEIPAEARVAALLAFGTTPDTAAAVAVRRALVDAAPLIVAAELERLAEVINEDCTIANALDNPHYSEDYDDGSEAAVTTMLARARELRGAAASPSEETTHGE